MADEETDDPCNYCGLTGEECCCLHCIDCGDWQLYVEGTPDDDLPTPQICWIIEQYEASIASGSDVPDWLTDVELPRLKTLCAERMAE